VLTRNPVVQSRVQSQSQSLVRHRRRYEYRGQRRRQIHEDVHYFNVIDLGEMQHLELSASDYTARLVQEPI